MPPPNITGILHMGHALFITLQDISTRYHRMKGDYTLWLPGTDHAGLATQAKLEAAMKEEGLDPNNGPAFDAFAETYKQNLQGTITHQLRRCGASADWSRETFTMDEGYSKAVQAAWVKVHESGLAYTNAGHLFINMEPLAKRLLDHLDAGDITIIPAGQEGTLRNFLDKIEPWDVGRDIRWGHKIPGWYFGSNAEKHGRKFSKSLGNGIDPLKIIDQYGCDAMRFALAEAATPGQDMKLWDEKFIGAKALRIKLWNAARYALGHKDRMGSPHGGLLAVQHPDDREMLNRLANARQAITEALEELRYHEAAFTLRQFIFNDFCGWYMSRINP